MSFGRGTVPSPRGHRSRSDRTLKDEPAPLLPLLHAFHERDGHLSEEALRSVSDGLRIPLADLYGTVTFYHHFARVPGGRDRPRVCDGPICKLKGADELLGQLEGATAMPCAGRCDDPIPVLKADAFLVGQPGGELSETPAPRPAPNPGGREECCFAGLRDEARATLAGYRSSGGYAALARAVQEQTPGHVLDVIDASGLAGRGGAGFPTGRKWRAVAEAAGEPKTIVCNADEGEPGCFKDRGPDGLRPARGARGHGAGGLRDRRDARLHLPALRVPAHPRRSSSGRSPRRARRACSATGILGTDFDFESTCGAAPGPTSAARRPRLLNSLEGKHPFPRNRPPYPVTHGFEDKPTAVNNVETLASVPPILERGADWYAGLGVRRARRHEDHQPVGRRAAAGELRGADRLLPLQTLLERLGRRPARGTRGSRP